MEAEAEQSSYVKELVFGWGRHELSVVVVCCSSGRDL